MRLFLAFFIMICSCILYASGDYGASFLNIGMGTRATAMGDAFTGIADDASAIYYNPAGLVTLKGMEFLFLHTRWLTDIDIGHVGFAKNMKKDDAIALSITYLHAEDVERDIYGRELRVFKNYYRNFSLSYARRMGKSLSFGGSLKFLQASLADHEANTYTLDIAMLYRWGRFSIGGAAQNVWGKMRFIKDEDILPFTLRIGVGYRVFPALLFGLDMVSKGDALRIGFGFEYRVMDILRIRGGYIQKGDDEFCKFNAGFGIELSSLRMDYAWAPYGELGNTHRVSLLLRLGKK